MNSHGQSLVEVLIAVAIGAILITAGVALIAPSLRANTQAAKIQIASSLGKELLDNVRVWSEGNWNNVLSLATGTTNIYYLNTSSSPFIAATGTESIVVSTSTASSSINLNTGLGGYWKFDEGTGTVAYDSSGNRYNGTLSSPAPLWTTGKIGGSSLTFASSTKITVSGSPQLQISSSTFTISLWIKPVSYVTGGLGNQWSNQIMQKQVYGTSTGSGFRYGLKSGFIPIFWTTETGGTLNTVASLGLSVGTFSHLVTTYDGATLTYYINGSPAGSVSGTYVAPISSSLELGGNQSDLWSTNSVIDDVRIYNRALSASEISQLYNLGQSSMTYSRYFYLSNVYRDSGGNIVTSGEPTTLSTKQVTVVYGWQGGPTNTMSTYVVRGRNNVFSQNDWSGGPGLTGPITSTNSQFATSSNIDYQTSTGSIYVSIPGY